MLESHDTARSGRLPAEELADFPLAGSRARLIGRFERDLAAWLATSEGRFAAWEARRRVTETAVRG